MKGSKDKIGFTLEPRDRINLGTRKPRPTARTSNPYPKPKGLVARHPFVYRITCPVQIQAQRPLPGKIRKVVIRVGSERVAVTVHFRDGTILNL